MCIIRLKPSDSSHSYHVLIENDLRNNTAAIRDELGLGQRDDIYYYKIPRMLGDDQRFRFHARCVDLVLEKFQLGADPVPVLCEDTNMASNLIFSVSDIENTT